MKLTIDFETRSYVDLAKSGTWPYAAHPSTQVLCLAIKEDDKIPVWFSPSAMFRDAATMVPNQITAEEVDRLVREADEIEAHNMAFEIAIWRHQMHEKLSITDLPAEKLRCSAAKAAMHALPRSLGAACDVLGLPTQKDKGGHALMLKMCKPLPPLKAQYAALAEKLELPLQKVKARFHSALLKKRWYADEHDTDLVRWHEDPDSCVSLLRYCLMDVEAEHGLSNRLRALPPMEQEIWEHDRLVNQRGLPVDVEACKAMIEMTEFIKVKLGEEFEALTGVPTPSSYAAFKVWVNAQGVECDGVSKGAISYLLDKGGLPEKVEEAFRIAKAYNKSSTAKFAALLRASGSDERVRETMMYHGASTGRVTGKIFQPTNLPRGSVKEVEFCIQLVVSRDWEAVELYIGDLMEAASSCLRGMICAKPGKKLIAADYSAIEGRVLAWLAGEESVIRIYEEGQNPYCAVAADCFGVPYEDIFNGHAAGDSEMTALRQKGKTGDLACGFGGGQGAVARFAPDMPIKERIDLVKRWRESHLKTKAFWYQLPDAAAKALKNPDRPYYLIDRDGNTNKKIGFAYRPKYGFLTVRLPSGRLLYYTFPEVVTKEIGPGVEAAKALVTPGVKFKFGGTTIWAEESGNVNVLSPGEEDPVVYPRSAVPVRRLDRETGEERYYGGERELWAQIKPVVYAWTVDGITKKWVKRELNPLILSENVTQATARDILMHAMVKKLEPAGYKIILQVYDEAVAEVDEDFGSVKEFEELMCDLPEWAEGLPVEAEGWEGKRFRK